ncbi:MAG: hypothetical protein M3R06_09415, partial [Chloroflexota bacterium]|nr:hypothetical protein [Chloroflexota bacterium]
FSPPSRQRSVVVVLVAWVAAFTHMLSAVMVAPLGLLALVLFRRRLLGERRDLVITLGLCALAPLVVLALTRLVAPPRSSDENSGLLSFAGLELFNWNRLTNLSWDTWSYLFAGGLLARQLPGAVVALSVALAVYLLFGVRAGMRPVANRGPLVALLVCYWVPVGLILVLTGDSFSRYLLHIHPLSLVVIAVVLVKVAALWEGRVALRRLPVLISPLIAAGCLVLLGIHFGMGLARQWEFPLVDADYYPSLLYVAQRQQPGEPVIVALPAAAYLVLLNREDIRFLAGQEGNPRVARYTSRTTDGRIVDYWIGAESIVSRASLCETFRRHPDAWVVVDLWRLREPWAYQGDIATIIWGMTTQLDVSTTGVVVLRAAPPELRSFGAVTLCASLDLAPSQAGVGRSAAAYWWWPTGPRSVSWAAQSDWSQAGTVASGRSSSRGK